MKTNQHFYNDVASVIEARGCQIYGNLSGLARAAGISRSTLQTRIRSAARWPLSHHWFALMLHLELPISLISVSDALAMPLPTDKAKASIAAMQHEIWQHALARRNDWPAYRNNFRKGRDE